MRAERAERGGKRHQPRVREVDLRDSAERREEPRAERDVPKVDARVSRSRLFQ